MSSSFSHNSPATDSTCAHTHTHTHTHTHVGVHRATFYILQGIELRSLPALTLDGTCEDMLATARPFG